MIRKSKHQREQGLGLVRHDKEHAGVVPPGTVTAYAGPVTSFVPEGWLACDGTSYRVDRYPRLFRAIGYTWGGSGDDFTVPNLKNVFLIGADTIALGTAQAGGTHTSQGGHQHDNHNVAIADHGTANRTTTGSATTTGTVHTGSHEAQGAHTHNAHTIAADALPPLKAINYIIKA